MRRFATALIFALLLTPAVQAQEPEAKPFIPIQSVPTETVPIESPTVKSSKSEAQPLKRIMPGSKLYIEPGDFRQIMSAAILKKQVPVTLVVFKNEADFILTTVTEAKKEKTGERVTKLLLFGIWAGSGRSFDATVNITNIDGEVVFGETVERRNAKKASRRIATKLKNQIEKNVVEQAGLNN
ncbi:MAG: hypothetical protein AAF329_01400 [Cyanobacteria bacterium P01_A01_bin.17]